MSNINLSFSKKRNYFKCDLFNVSMKKSEDFVFFTILAILFIVSIIFSANFSLAQTTDIPAQEKIEQAYSWLEYKVGNWQSLNTQDHSLAILALQCRGSGQAGITRLKVISFENTNFRCWGIGPTRPTSIANCHLFSTAFARLALSDENLTKVDNWILNQSKFFSELYWFIQLDTNRGAEMNCVIDYGGGSANISVSDNKTVRVLSQTGNNCFSATNPNYWLAISKTCYQKETEFKIKCDVNDTSLDYTASLLYRKDADVRSQNYWYVGPDSEKAKSGETTALTTKAYCLKDSTGNCNYEATVWSAFALKEAENERYKDFIPYIVIMSTETNNLKYFPQAFLYLITGSIEAGQTVATMQEPSGFWCAISKLITGTSCSNTPYGQFYDTALAGLTEQGNLGTEKNGARYYLTNFSDGKTFLKTRIAGNDYMYWKCNERNTIDQCKDVRDTAFLLWSLWGKLLCAGTGEEDHCLNHDGICKTACESGEEDVNFTCGSGEVCCVSSISQRNCATNEGVCKSTCDSSEAELTQIACSGMNVCCKPYTNSYCISDLWGDLCEYDEMCIGDKLDSADNIGGRQCCAGSCTFGNAGDKTCSELSGYPCTANEVCVNEDTWDIIPFVNTLGDSRCCFDNYGISVCVQNTECSDIGEVCDSGKECDVTPERTKDEKECCSGICLSSCSSLGGEQCGTKETCSTKSFSSNSIEDRCCIGECKESKNLTWLWILFIILLLLGGGFALYWFKFRKKGEKKEEKPSIFKGMFPSRPRPVQTQQSRPLIQPGLAPRPSSQPIQSQYPRTMTQKFDVTIKSPSNVKTTAKKTKTDVELERTLSKLKRMTKSTKKK